MGKAKAAVTHLGHPITARSMTKAGRQRTVGFGEDAWSKRTYAGHHEPEMIVLSK